MRYERLNEMLELLADRGHMSVEELSAELGVSPATTRRDLDHLASQQLLMRTRGGAVASGVADLPIRYKSARHATEKERIAARASELVSRGMTVGMNGGTTMSEVARAIARRSDPAVDDDGGEVTIVTNAVNIANELTVRQHIKLVVVGGVARAQSYELIGPLAQATIEQLNLDLVFLGVDAISAEAGATTHHEGEASINAALAARARRVVVVADGSKVREQAAFVRICSIDAIDALVTDESADPEVIAQIVERGVEVYRT
ncbi:alkaline phosphatase [Aeromicrobium sp. PE09-221]|uniref:DeoR/GlpR family DNA-binding transcription regulator n=1 Tax=Aeromicrobium sp. PE09-221 TaxID=1898043 RepID=UPI000B3EB447|nr:DeoR/GlpR family DNA-binding transcription regulator [Aeromicrobium sp. PE09-221]OUZ11965.1 alkaline phosphatase [Aeromicrobium sp. PE09-221]